MIRFQKVLTSSSWSRIAFNLSKLSRTSTLLNQHTCQAVPYTMQAVCFQNGIVSQTSVQRSSYSTDNSQMSELEYERLADETMDSLTDMFDELPDQIECDPEYDVVFSSGVLTVKINPEWGTYVINKQVPNKQIWFSSPLSGPKRYDYIDGCWIYSHDGSILHELLNTEISQAIGQPLDFTQCTHGKR